MLGAARLGWMQPWLWEEWSLPASPGPQNPLGGLLGHLTDPGQRLGKHGSRCSGTPSRTWRLWVCSASHWPCASRKTQCSPLWNGHIKTQHTEMYLKMRFIVHRGLQRCEKLLLWGDNERGCRCPPAQSGQLHLVIFGIMATDLSHIFLLSHKTHILSFIHLTPGRPSVTAS